MKVNFDHASGEHLVRLNEAEAVRLIAALDNVTMTSPDPQNDTSANLEDALTEILT